MRSPSTAGALALAALLAAGCGRSDAAVDAGGRASAASAAPPHASATSAASASGATSARLDTTTPAPAARAPEGSFARLFSELSEPDARFFSANRVSNETSLLQVAGDLERLARPGGVYLGVGPEQSFTYIALTRPSLAFIVDIRRDNALLHLLYRAAFDEAESRAHFLALLLGRADGDPRALPPDADLDAVLARVDALPPSDEALEAIHARLERRIERGYGIKLDARDRAALLDAHRAFAKDGLGIHFSLTEENGRRYPTLRELLRLADASGRRRGFLATESAFRFVQALEREGRIIPIVGDFAGDRAMPGIAAELRARKLTVSTFYVSNVEQYLFSPKGTWERWVRNVAALPIDDRSLFVRAWLDQGRRHPRQLEGQRTATVLQRIAEFEAHQAASPYRSYWQVATDAPP